MVGMIWFARITWCEICLLNKYICQFFISKHGHTHDHCQCQIQEGNYAISDSRRHIDWKNSLNNLVDRLPVDAS